MVTLCSNVSSKIVIPVYPYEHLNSGARKNKKVLFYSIVCNFFFYRLAVLFSTSRQLVLGENCGFF